MSKKKRRAFTPEQKAEAVKIVKNSGKSVTQVAQEMGLTVSALRNWTRQEEINQSPAPRGPLTTDERAELVRLRKELKRVEMERDFFKKSGGLLRQGDVTVFQVIAAEEASFPVSMMCESLEVSRSGYYAWKTREPSARAQENAALAQEVAEIHAASRRTYGSPRVRSELRGRGRKVSRKRVARIMREEGIQGRRRPKFTRTTDSNHRLPVADNVLDRNFTASKPDKAWVADITYVWTLEGWLYLAVIIDLFSRRVVGWSMADHMRTELVLGALRAALGHREPSDEGLVFHSDRGSQYAADDYREALRQAGMTCSMSRKGNCWDNAVAESFNSTLKTELVHRTIFLTRENARTTISEWIEVFYNRQRRHSSIGYSTPIAYEESFYAEQAQTRAA
ncbi:IS3 family transposase [Nannocystis sp. RBIL2]|uniref:IS3 family transposase n=1 Tax=Nannocystis sp. RBIL2 TaxID=2996788 RepID=UPI00226D7429|nr:IS3 family transposase [Nannocystis sp. RBIL2]MCY1066671.1 IS3 family transposase [Nannocystis sp. RBIL2]MCY1070145.1 IS3 family transposase [Nannocystis sp. RBIL2]MCY1070327.1 IS3 family transposase [Nannocystis sp. RBIL2]